MKRKINTTPGDVDIEHTLKSFKKLKIEEGVTNVDKATQTEIQIYTDIEIQQFIRKMQSRETISHDNFGQTYCLHQTKT